MTAENMRRVHTQRALVAVITRAIDQAVVSLDLPKGSETSKAIVDALAQVSQVHQIELDMVVDPLLGKAGR